MENIKSCIQQCTNCSLCSNQKPLLDRNTEASVFWVGVSAVKVESVENEVPLGISTNTGKLISEIEKLCDAIGFYKTNIVKCLPLDGDKIRYPTKNEMVSCYSNLNMEIKAISPNIVIMLGKQVSDFISSKLGVKFNSKLDENFNYAVKKLGKISFIPIHHPSYILVYKRKKVEEYKRNVAELINRIMDKNATICADASSKFSIYAD